MSLAVYTTVYPGVERYLVDWFRSLRQQTDQDFQLWIGSDMLACEPIQKMLEGNLDARWVVAPSGATAAEVRQHVLAQVVETCSAVVLVDSDDLLHPTRVAAARTGLDDSELAGCALCLIDQQGKQLGLTYNLPDKLGPDDVFPHNNVYGFSNSAFRSELLKKCLPIPPAAVLVDWFLATRAWLLGARLAFDRVPRMDYRQHAVNTARVRFPVDPDQVDSDTSLVRQHFQLVLAELTPEFKVDRVAAVRRAAAEVDAFHQSIVLHAGRLDDYARALNDLHPAPLWWSSVANPLLRHLWTRGTEYESC
jgi:hypothetical protein